MTLKSHPVQKKLLWLISICLIVLWSGAVFAQEAKITMINVLIEGTKIWLPSAVTAKEGEKVTLKLVNKLDKPHGFFIPALDIKVVVKENETKEIVFQAPDAGSYEIKCHLHAAHLGGVLFITK